MTDEQSDNEDLLPVSRRSLLKATGTGALATGGVLTLGTASVSADEEGGPVVLMGLDSELTPGDSSHGPPEEHAAMVESILSNVRREGEGILVLGAHGSDPIQYWEEDVGENVDEEVTIVTGTDDIADVEFDGYAMVGVASSEHEVTGGMTDAENEALIDRSVDLADFVNAGGGLLGKTQTGFTNEWLYADPLRVFETRTGLSYSTVEVTGAGNDIGFTQSGMSGWCCWHDTFIEFPDIYDVLVINDDGGSGDREPGAIGGAAIVLIAEVDVRIQGPDEVEQGEQRDFELRLRNGGDSTEEPVRVEHTITRQGGISPSDLELEYFDEDDEEWQEFPLEEENGALTGSISPDGGFVMDEQFDETRELRASFFEFDQFTIETETFGVGSDGDDYDTSIKTIDVGEADVPVTITSTNSPITEGETLQVNAEVANTSDDSIVTTVELTSDELIDAVESDGTTVSLQPGETDQVSLEYESEVGDEGQYTVQVETDDALDSTEVTIDPTGDFVLHGTVTDGDDEPLSDVGVGLYEQTSLWEVLRAVVGTGSIPDPEAYTETGSSGGYQFEDVDPDTYATLFDPPDGFEGSPKIEEPVTVPPEDEEPERVDVTLEERPLDSLARQANGVVDSAHEILDANTERTADTFVSGYDEFAGADDESPDVLGDTLDITEHALDFDPSDDPDFETYMARKIGPMVDNYTEHGIERALEQLLDRIASFAQDDLQTAADALLDEDWLLGFEHTSRSDVVELGYETTPVYDDVVGGFATASDRIDDIATEEPPQGYNPGPVHSAVESVENQLQGDGVPGVVVLPGGQTFQIAQSQTYADAYEGTEDNIDTVDTLDTASQIVRVSGKALTLTGKGAPIGAALIKIGSAGDFVTDVAEPYLKTRLAMEWGLTNIYWFIDAEDLEVIGTELTNWIEDEALVRPIEEADVEITDVDLNPNALGFVVGNQPSEQPDWWTVVWRQNKAVKTAEVTVENNSNRDVNVRLTMHDMDDEDGSFSDDGSMLPETTENEGVFVPANGERTFFVEYSADASIDPRSQTMTTMVWVDGVVRDDEQTSFRTDTGLDTGILAADEGSLRRAEAPGLTNARKAADEGLTYEEIDDLLPTKSTVIDAEVTPEQPVVEETFTADTDTEAVTFMLSGVGDVALQIIDEQGRQVGYDPTINEERLEIPTAQYSGLRSTPEFVRIPTTAASTVTVRVVGYRFAEGTPDSVTVTASEIPEREPQLAVGPQKPRLAVTPGSEATVTYEIKEWGKQEAISGVTLDAGAFENADGESLPTDVEFAPPTAFDVDPDEQVDTELGIQAPADVTLPDLTRFEGPVTVDTTNAGTVTTTVSALFLDTDVANAGLLGAGENVDALRLTTADTATVPTADQPAGATVRAAYDLETVGTGTIRLEFDGIDDPENITPYAVTADGEWHGSTYGRSRSEGTVSTSVDASEVEYVVLTEETSLRVSTDRTLEVDQSTTVDVFQVFPDRSEAEITGQATLSTDDEAIEIENNTVVAVESGEATLTVEFDGLTVTVTYEIVAAIGQYTNEEGIVDTDGLRDAIDDWRAGEIETDLLRAVIDAWRSGEPV